MNKRICCFGELLLRLSPETENKNWLHTDKMPFFIGGAELNVATALANWEWPVKYITALPDNYLSRQIVEYTTGKNIDCTSIIYAGDRLGIYYLPLGSELKHTGVIYDRANSSFSGLQPGTIDWNKIFEDCSWFHFSAISPALNEALAEVCREALETASARNMTISLDLNYRSKLWQYGKKPEDIMPSLVKHCDIIMGNIWAAESLLGIKSTISDSKGKTREELIEAAGITMKTIHRSYPKLQSMAFTFRLDDNYFAVLQHGASMEVSKQYPVTGTVDKVGSGDCFMAGLLYGLNQQMEPKNIINFAAAAAVGKLREAGDATKQTVQFINQRINQ